MGRGQGKFEVTPSPKTKPPPLDQPQGQGQQKQPPQTIEDLLENLGAFGKFQALILVLVLILEIPASFIPFLVIFTNAKPSDWTCDDEPVPNSMICSCNGTLRSLTSSVISEWHLVCSYSWVSDFITSVQMIGMMLGALASCQMADWYGRRRAFIGVVLFMIFGQGITVVSTGPYFYAGGRFISGFGMSGYLGISSIYTLEFQTKKWRQLCGSIGPWGQGVMLLSLIAYYIHPWRLLTAVSILPFVLIIVIFPLLPESPRWLLRNHQIESAHRVLSYMAKMNGRAPVTFETLQSIAEFERRDLTSISLSVSISSKQQCNLAMEPEGEDHQMTKSSLNLVKGKAGGAGGGVKSGSKVKRFTYLDFFRDSTLCLPTIYQITIMCSTGITYYGISFNVKNMDGSPYLIVMLMGLSDAIGYPAALLISDRLGRRVSLAIYMTLGAGFLVVLAIFELTVGLGSWPNMTVALCLLGKFCIAGGRSCARTLVGELYPTAVRSMGSGLGGVGASIGGALAPQLVYLGTDYSSVPYFVFGIIGITGALFSFLMTETMGRPLNEEVETLSNDSTNPRVQHCKSDEKSTTGTFVVSDPPDHLVIPISISMGHGHM